MPAFGCLVSSADFVVVEFIFLADGDGGEVGHKDVCACLDALFTAKGVYGSQGCCRGEQQLGEHKAQKADHKQGQLYRAGRGLGKGGIVVRHEGAYAYHMGFQLPDKEHVVCEVFRGLARGAYHKASPGLETDFFEIVQALLAAAGRESGGVQMAVMNLIRRFMAQEVAVGAGLEEALVALLGTFADGKGNGAVGVGAFDGSDDIFQFILGEITILPALKHEGAKAKAVPLAAAFQDFLLGQAVAFGMWVAPADAAVIAVIFAVICKFD